MEDGVKEALKSAGICITCRRRFAEPHSFYCSECLEKDRKRASKNYHRLMQDETYAKQQRETKRKRYYWLKENGYCTKCGKHEQYTDTLCLSCWRKSKIYYENNKWKKNKKVY